MADGLQRTIWATSATVNISLSAAVGVIAVPVCDTVTTKEAGNVSAVVGFMILL
jgi:hypothetical protein